MYGLSPGKEGVFKWDRKEDKWSKVGGPASQIAGNIIIKIIIIPFYNFYKYSFVFLVTSGGVLYGISPNGEGCWIYSGHGDEWTKSSGHLRHLIGGGIYISFS